MGHAVVGFCTQGQHHRIGWRVLWLTCRVVPNHLVAADLLHRGVQMQLAVLGHSIEHAPAPHDGQLTPGLVGWLQHRDQAAAGKQELGQLQANQAAAHDQHLLAHRHPQF